MNNLISIDTGTAFYKVASNNGFSITLPSISARIDSYRNLRYKAGRGKVTFEGKCYQIGNEVINYNPKLYDIQNDVILNIVTGVAYALPTTWEGGDVSLALTILKSQNSMINVLRPFEITLDDRPIYFNISNITYYYPGFGSYKYFRTKFPQFNSGSTIVLDVGFSSTSLIVVDNCTNQVLCSPMLINGGVHNLLEQVRKDSNFRTYNNGVELPLKTLLYKPVKHLQQTVNAYNKAWWLNIIGAVVCIIDLKDYDINTVLVTGGGCSFLKSLFQGDINIHGVSFHLCPDYNMSEVYGNLLHKEQACPVKPIN